jgi:tRNA threonylcarbamoyladenosine biosynthesis protein TsaE
VAGVFLADEAATEACGQRLARALTLGGVVFLEGTLGAGKTCLARAILRALGHQGSVKSPTYTLVEPYELVGLGEGFVGQEPGVSLRQDGLGQQEQGALAQQERGALAHQGAPYLVYHFDLYRLIDPEELEFMGIRDYFAPGHLCLVEWPSRGAGVLPAPDVTLTLTPEGTGRRLEAEAFSPLGQAIQRSALDQGGF